LLHLFDINAGFNLTQSGTKAIDFNERFDCVVCLNADIPGAEVFSSIGNIPVIAADGAANRLASMGIIPGYIIGDMDSFDPGAHPGLAEQATIIRNPDQETNDFEKILMFAEDKGYHRILIFGFHGGELEHSLNNWSVFIRHSGQLNLCIYDKGRYGFSACRSFRMATRPGEIVSLIPQPEARLTTDGLRWALKGETLKLGMREGARNRAVTSSVTITFHSGELIVFIDSRLPYAPSLSLCKP